METVISLINELIRLPWNARVRFHDGSGQIRKVTVAPYREDEPDIVWIGLGLSRRKAPCKHGLQPSQRCAHCD